APDERLRANRLARGDVLLDDAEEELPLTLGELRCDHAFHGRWERRLQRLREAGTAYASKAAVTASPRKRPRSVRASSPSAQRTRPSRSTRCRPAGSRAGSMPASGSGSSRRSASITRSPARVAVDSSSGSRGGRLPAASRLIKPARDGALRQRLFSIVLTAPTPRPR